MHDEIRAFADWLDASAPPIHELAPDRSRPTPAGTRRPSPARPWIRAVLAFAAVLVVGIPLFGLLEGGPEDADEPTPLAPAHITAAPADGPTVLVSHGGQVVTGLDFEPGSAVSAGLEGPSYPGGSLGLAPVTVQTTGRFDIELPPGRAMTSEDRAVVTSGSRSWTVPAIFVEFERLDPVTDLAVGTAEVPDGTAVIIRVEGGPGLTWVETETFDGRWAADLTDLVDVTLETVGSAWVASGDGFAASAEVSAVPPPARLHLDVGGLNLEGAGFTPDGRVEIRLNGQPLADVVSVGPGGRFNVDLTPIEPSSGDVFDVVDGDVTRSIRFADLEATYLDTETWRSVSGMADLEDGSAVRVSGGVSGTVDTTVVDGRWDVTFASAISSLSIEFSDDDGDVLAGRVVDGLLDGLPPADASVRSMEPATFPTPFDGAVIALDENRGVMGWGLTPGDVVSLSIAPDEDGLGNPFPGLEVPALAEVAADGTFLAEAPIGFQGGDVVTVASGDDTWVIPFDWLNLDRFDTGTGLAAGWGPEGSDVTLQVQDGPNVSLFETTIGEQEWSISGVPTGSGLVGTAWMAAGDGYVVTPATDDSGRAPGIEYHPGDPWLAGYGFGSNVPLSIRVDDIPTDLEVRTTVSGTFGFAPTDLELAPGTVIDVTDGTTERSLAIHSIGPLSVDGGRVTATTTLPDGSLVEVIAERARVRQRIDAVVVGGTWEAVFPTGGPFDLFDIRWNEDDGDAIAWMRTP